ncbi:hypothetical protein GGR52DRAFT_575835 [Hypoxylon sp. FL1284]|nr:hypothetical protein GGR52DRAFT_575835 [Hypoxylon sp. FL1284]
MASNGLSEGGPHVPETVSAGPPSQLPPEENESEWEYEYSTTETETFYVTLDLSKADFTDRDASTIFRPGYKGSEKADRAKLYLNRRMSPDNSNGSSANDSDEDDDGPRDAHIQQPVADDDADDHQVQIIELHSENPVISYKGRVYQGQWSENIGTEFLMTRRDEDMPLPALLHLDHDVELLGASSARVTVDEIELRARERPNKRRRKINYTKEANAMRPIVPPAERWATQTRRDQGSFLASLIELKKRRGETDEVTVIAKGTDLRVNHNRSRKRKGHRGKFNLPHLRGPRRPRGADLLRTLSIREHSPAAPSSNASPLGPDAGSTPTPRRWEDLEGQEDYEGDGAAMDGVNSEYYDEEEEEYEGEGEDEGEDEGEGDDEDEELDENGYSGSEEDGSIDDMDVDED